jgi:hypothetical protein
MDSSKIKLIFVFVLALFFALYLGVSAATAQFEAIAWVLGGVTISVCLLMGRNIWLLIPFFAAFNLQLRLPGQPSSLLMAQLLVIGFSFMLVLARKVRMHVQFTELEFWVLMLTILLLQVYARNPAGLWIMQTDSVGGKAYFLFVISLICCIYMCFLSVDSNELKKIFPLVVLGSIANLSIGVLGKLFPTIGYYTGSVYSIVEENNGVAVDKGRATRFAALSTFGLNLSLWVSSFKNPLKALFHPFWLILILISLASALYAGFRSGLVSVLLTYIVGTWYRGGLISIIIGALLGALAIAVLAVVNSFAPLPPNVQRVLSFLPGTWEQRYIDDGKSSTEWRMEIWEEVLFTDRWIENKWFGDGLGFSRAQLAYQMSLTNKQANRIGSSGFDFQRESILASGDYHSGPVSTIRVVGYVGLVILILFQIRLGVHAHRQIMRCRGTEWYPLALLIGIPIIWSPVFFHFVFGDFRAEIIVLLMGVGMMRILEKTLPLPLYNKGHN